MADGATEWIRNDAWLRRSGKKRVSSGVELMLRNPMNYLMVWEIQNWFMRLD